MLKIKRRNQSEENGKRYRGRTKRALLVGFMPHGMCYLWSPPMLILQIVSDALIAIAYFSIPALLIYFIKKRNDIPFSFVFAMFGAFIVLCGMTHVLGIWTIWHADFWLDGIVKALTATVSVATAITLVPLVPKALSLKSPTALRELNERLQTGYRRIIETANDGVWMFDDDARTTYVNHRMATMLGYDEAEMLGRPLNEFTCAPVSGGIFALGVSEAGSTEVDEIRLRHRNGSEIFGLVSTSTISDEKLGASVLAMITDVTARKRSERRLVESEARLRALAAAVPQIIWTATADGAVEYSNERWLSYTGVEMRETLGTTWEAVVHPDDLPATMSSWQHSIATGCDFEGHMRYRAADGTYRWFLVRAIAVRDDAGNVERWFGTSTDIEVQKRGAASLQFLADASLLLTSSSDMTETLGELARLAVPTIADHCFIFLLEGKNLSCEAQATNDADAATLRLLAEEVCRTGNSIVRPVGEPLGSTIVVPLEVRGESFGAIAFVERRAERLVGDAGLQLAELIAKRTATAIESARLYERERRTAKHLRYIADAGKRLSTSLDLQATLDALCELAVPELADVAIVNLCTADAPPYVAAISFADPELAIVANDLRGHVFVQQLVPSALLPGFLSGQPQIVREVDDEFLEHFVVESMFPLAHRFGFGASLVRLPLVSEGVLLGSLSLFVTRDKLEREYTDFDIPFLQELGQRGALAINNAQHYGREHRVADILQKASLPVSLPCVPGIRFSSVYEPGKSEAHIGGDWYDAVRLADGRVVISIGDVAGSGLDAAVTMGNLRHVLRGVAQIDADPITILDAADKTLRAEHDRMVTAFVGVLDPVTLTLTYASAGHPPPSLRTPDGTVQQLPCSGLPLGLRERNEEPARSIELERGSLLVLYTDGLTESTRDIEEGERLLETALDTFVFDAESDAARAIHDAVLGSGMPGDDVAILTIEILGPMPSLPVEQRIWQWSLTSSNAEAMRTARHELFETLETGGMLAKDCHTAELVLGELLGNVMRHAPGDADVILDWSGTAPVLNILDSGAGFEYSARLPTDIFSDSGRGLFLVSALTEAFHVSKRRAGGSHARAVLAVGRGRS